MNKSIWHTDDGNIFSILEKIDFEKHCEQYAVGFQRDTDTPTMTKFRQESMKQFCFSLIQRFYEKFLADALALETELERTRKALDKAKWWLNEIVESHRYTPISTAEMALKEITALEQKDK